MNDDTPIPNFPRTDNDRIITGLRYKDDMGRICQIKIKSEDKTFIYEDAFTILSPGVRSGADCILNVLPHQIFVGPNYKISTEKNRLQLFDQATKESTIYYDDNKLQSCALFCKQCGAVFSDAGLVRDPAHSSKVSKLKV